MGGDLGNDGAGRVRSDLIDWEDDDPLPRVRGPHRPASHGVRWPPSPPSTGDTRACAQVHQVNIAKFKLVEPLASTFGYVLFRVPPTIFS